MILLTAGSILRLTLVVSTRRSKMISKRTKRTILTRAFVKMKMNNRLKVMNSTIPALDLC